MLLFGILPQYIFTCLLFKLHHSHPLRSTSAIIQLYNQSIQHLIDVARANLLENTIELKFYDSSI